MIVLAIVLAALLLIALIPVGARVRYDEDGLAVAVAAGPLNIPVYPPKKKLKKRPDRRGRPKAAKEKKRREKKKPEKKPAAKKPGGLAAFRPYLDLGLGLLGRLRRKLRVKELTAVVFFGGTDAADTAIAYGRAWAALGALTAALENVFLIEKRDIRAELDYTKKKMELQLLLDVRMRIGDGVALAFWALVRFLKIQIQKKKAVQEK